MNIGLFKIGKGEDITKAPAPGWMDLKASLHTASLLGDYQTAFLESFDMEFKSFPANLRSHLGQGEAQCLARIGR